MGGRNCVPNPTQPHSHKNVCVCAVGIWETECCACVSDTPAFFVVVPSSRNKIFLFLSLSLSVESPFSAAVFLRRRELEIRTRL